MEPTLRQTLPLYVRNRRHSRKCVGPDCQEQAYVAFLTLLEDILPPDLMDQVNGHIDEFIELTGGVRGLG